VEVLLSILLLIRLELLVVLGNQVLEHEGCAPLLLCLPFIPFFLGHALEDDFAHLSFDGVPSVLETPEELRELALQALGRKPLAGAQMFLCSFREGACKGLKRSNHL